MDTFTIRENVHDALKKYIRRASNEQTGQRMKKKLMEQVNQIGNGLLQLRLDKNKQILVHRTPECDLCYQPCHSTYY